ncbi:hypothetical protein Y013_01795 [Rhodococcus pyridinivorans SB3094]|uniref:Uncharacterized protein n=1 Tax=Rhodococcus pyridinivorans SB3094 TaxID=1435356 RepID=V9XBV5_9NOCA|nr:hypothetical protein Y013_01795 [Rhodococcus pyridinivorans SB3094]
MMFSLLVLEDRVGPGLRNRVRRFQIRRFGGVRQERDGRGTGPHRRPDRGRGPRGQHGERLADHVGVIVGGQLCHSFVISHRRGVEGHGDRERGLRLGEVVVDGHDSSCWYK